MFVFREKEWTGDYITDFSKLLPQLRSDGFTYDEVDIKKEQSKSTYSYFCTVGEG